MDTDKLAIAFAVVMGPLACIVAYIIWEDAPRSENTGVYEAGTEPDGSDSPAVVASPSFAPPAPAKPVTVTTDAEYVPATATAVVPNSVPTDNPPLNDANTTSAPAPVENVAAVAPPVAPVPAPPAAPINQEPEAKINLTIELPPYQMQLANERLIDLTKEFDVIGKAVARAREKASDKNARTVTYPNGKPMIYLSHSGDKLDGDSAAFYEAGSPMTLVSYENGKRDGNFCAWDDKNRPIYLLQYKNDKKNGYCCIFNSCDSRCNHAHLWMVQEWRAGKLYATHHVSNAIHAKTHEYDGVDFQPFERDPNFEMADNELKQRERQLDTVEKPAVQFTVDYFNCAQECRTSKASYRSL